MAGQREFYFGRSGQLVVMAEFLRRGYNAAIPEIDRGDDIFVVEDATGKLSRIQVKAGVGRGTSLMYACFNVKTRQLEEARHPDLWYVFTAHYGGLWREFLVIGRKDLLRLHQVDGIGYVTQRGHRMVRFHCSFRTDDVRCQGVSLQKYRDKWTNWPEIIP